MLGGNIVAADATAFTAIALDTTTGTLDVANNATVHLKSLHVILQMIL